MSERTPRKAFNPITADLDEKVDELARRKGIPTLVDPEPMPPGIASGETAESGQSTSGADTATAREGENSSSGPVAARSLPPGEYATIKFEAPLYLIDELHSAARRQRSSLKYLLLSTLKAQGFDVRDEDLIPDGRRLRGSRAL
jgi:hypothetical protein